MHACVIVAVYSKQSMHERLAEMKQPVLSPLDPHRPSQVVAEEDDGLDLSEVESVQSNSVTVDDQEATVESKLQNQPDFDFRLSMLPAWAQKAAMSRPSVAGQVKDFSVNSATDGGTKTVEGKWAEVCRISV